MNVFFLVNGVIVGNVFIRGMVTINLFSLGPAPRPGPVMVLMCVSVCSSVCL